MTAETLVPAGVLGNGGGGAAGGSFAISGTLGQSIVGAASGPAIRGGWGFWLVESTDELPVPISEWDPGTGDVVPHVHRLEQNAPNPFNPTTRIRFALPRETQASVRVYDLAGRAVAVLVDETLAQGFYEITFDAARLASGVYIYRLRTRDVVMSRKLVLLK